MYRRTEETPSSSSLIIHDSTWLTDTQNPGTGNPGTQYLIGVEKGDVDSETTYFLKAKR